MSLDVLTPTYNYAVFLGDALSSVRCQSGVERHVVVDGASRDGTKELLATQPAQVRWLSEPDHGQSDALNKAVRMSNASHVGWLNADEFYLPGALQYAHDVLEEQNVDVLFGDCAFVDADGRFLRLLPSHRMDARTLRNYGCFVSSCATFTRRSLLVETPWDPSYRRAMDWHLWLRLLEADATFLYVPRVFSCFRVHAGQVTAVPERDEPEEFVRLAQVRQLPQGRLQRGLPAVAGRLRHMGLKYADGGYQRQLRARRLRGTDLRWWAGHDQRAAADRLSAV